MKEQERKSFEKKKESVSYLSCSAACELKCVLASDDYETP